MDQNTLADLIRHQKLQATGPEDTVQTACILMASANVGALPVADARGGLVGMLSERDVIKRCIIVHRSSETTLVREAMTPNPQWLPPEAPLEEAYKMMIKGRFRHLPVCKDARLVGVVSIRDFNLHSNSLMDLLRRSVGKGATGAKPMRRRASDSRAVRSIAPAQRVKG